MVDIMRCATTAELGEFPGIKLCPATEYTHARTHPPSIYFDLLHSILKIQDHYEA